MGAGHTADLYRQAAVTAEGLHLLAALAPIVVVVVLLAARLPSLWVGTAGLVTAIVSAATSFPLTSAQIGSAASQMGPVIIEVALIMLGGTALAEVMTHSGAQQQIAAWLERAETGTDRTLTLLLLVYGMTPLMESITGYGLGVVITAPLLVRLGLTPVKAVLSGLLGLVLVPWGSLAPGTLIAAQLGGQDFTRLGIWSALLTLPVLVISMVTVLTVNLGRCTLGQITLAAAVIVVAWLTLIGANMTAGPPLSGVLAGAAVIATLLAVARVTSGALPRISRALLRALIPYLVLVTGILLMTGLTVAIDDPDAPAWLASPALWLLVAAITAITTLGQSQTSRRRIIWLVVKRWLPIAGTAIVFMSLGITMASSGMAEELATTASRAGPGFVAAIPGLGAFGGYLTGSNTGAAAMFSTATTTAATGLGANPLIALAGQNVAGSFAIIASPPRIALATAVALRSGDRLPASATSMLLAVVGVTALVLGAVVAVLA